MWLTSKSPQKSCPPPPNCSIHVHSPTHLHGTVRRRCSQRGVKFLSTIEREKRFPTIAFPSSNSSDSRSEEILVRLAHNRNFILFIIIAAAAKPAPPSLLICSEKALQKVKMPTYSHPRTRTMFFIQKDNRLLE